jgi:hypothetical protein
MAWRRNDPSMYPARLLVHHRDQGNQAKSLITLCIRCHMRIPAESLLARLSPHPPLNIQHRAALADSADMFKFFAPEISSVYDSCPSERAALL